MRPWHRTERVLEVDFDVVFFLATAALTVLGTVMIFSSSYFVSKELYGAGAAMTLRHLAHLAFGVTGMLVLMSIDYRVLSRRRVVLGMLVVSMVALMCCFVPVIGRAGGHARRWVGIGPAVFQASELAKIALVIFFANHLARKTRCMDDFHRGPLPLLLVVAAVCLLILIEPDFGTAATIGAWSVIVLFMSGMSRKHLAALVCAALPVAAVAMVMEPYRRSRITAFLDPWKDMLGSGYQAVQSMASFASGGLFGTGLGEGSQKLFYLPAPHTDFILAVLGEETGFVGVTLVACLFAAWVWRGFSIALATKDSFGHYMVLACVSLVGLQAILNMGVALCLLPTKGLPLPFFSYGGSTLVSTLLMCGLVLSVSRRARL